MIPADARSGQTVGKYRLHEIVGRGGMGVVYRGEHVYIGREVAVKILHEGYGSREESVKRFLREARAASLINHPNIVEVTDFGKANDGTVFFVMELLVGEPLDAVLARDRRLDLLRSITICNQLAAALAAAHRKGIIHRDLKPENVMLIPREGRRELVRRVDDETGAHELSEKEKLFDFVKILDFGVAKVREPETQKGRVTQAGVVFGTPEYMAPETARVGFSDARSDIYALGVMFYEMMTGTVPFTGETPVEVMMKQVNERVPAMHEIEPEAEITEDAERMILKALAKDPEQRHQSMEEFHRDLQKCYGKLRFRRTVRTPSEANINTPPATTIPLTKKKQPGQLPGALPTEIGWSSPVSVEIEPGVVRPGGQGPGSGPISLTPGPRLPGLAGGSPNAPILLTKKKTHPSGQRSSLEEMPRMTPSSPIRLGDTPGPTAAPTKKRATLPFGVPEEGARPPTATGVGLTPGPTPAPSTVGTPAPARPADSGARVTPARPSDSGVRMTPARPSDSGVRMTPPRPSDSGVRTTPARPSDSGVKLAAVLPPRPALPGKSSERSGAQAPNSGTAGTAGTAATPTPMPTSQVNGNGAPKLAPVPPRPSSPGVNAVPSPAATRPPATTGNSGKAPIPLATKTPLNPAALKPPANGQAKPPQAQAQAPIKDPKESSWVDEPTAPGVKTGGR